GRQPRQLAGQPLLGVSATGKHQGQGAAHLLVVRSRARRLPGRERRRHVEGSGLGVRPLLHANALGSDAAPDPLNVIKTALRLALVAALANATWRVGTAYVKHYRF